MWRSVVAERTLTVRPLAPDTWDAFARLVEANQDAGPGTWGVWVCKTGRENLPDQQPRNTLVML